VRIVQSTAVVEAAAAVDGEQESDEEENQKEDKENKPIQENGIEGESTKEEESQISTEEGEGDGMEVRKRKGKKEKEEEVEEENEKEEYPSEDEDENWKADQEKKKKKKKNQEISKISHSVHSPYFPSDKQEFWWIYLVDKKAHQLMTAPFLMTNLIDEEDAILKFTAPRKPGVYHLTLNIKSDSYVQDFDQQHDVKFDVKPAKPVVESHPQWDALDEESEVEMEDSAVEDSDLCSDDDLDSDPANSDEETNP